MYCSPPGSSVHGILQARILEWVSSQTQGLNSLRSPVYLTSLPSPRGKFLPPVISVSGPSYFFQNYPGSLCRPHMLESIYFKSTLLTLTPLFPDFTFFFQVYFQIFDHLMISCNILHAVSARYCNQRWGICRALKSLRELQYSGKACSISCVP